MLILYCSPLKSATFSWQIVNFDNFLPHKVPFWQFFSKHCKFWHFFLKKVQILTNTDWRIICKRLLYSRCCSILTPYALCCGVATDCLLNGNRSTYVKYVKKAELESRLLEIEIKLFKKFKVVAYEMTTSGDEEIPRNFVYISNCWSN